MSGLFINLAFCQCFKLYKFKVAKLFDMMAEGVKARLGRIVEVKDRSDKKATFLAIGF